MVIILFSVFGFSTLAQSKERSEVEKNNSVYVEAGGHGGYWSIGYSRSVYQFKYGKLNLRGGVSVRNLYDFQQNLNPDLIFPFSFTSQFGAKSNFIELGLNRTVSSLSYFSPQVHEQKRMLGYSSGFYVGYAYDPSDQPISVRVFYSPITDFYSILDHWGGIGLNYAF